MRTDSAEAVLRLQRILPDIYCIYLSIYLSIESCPRVIVAHGTAEIHDATRESNFYFVPYTGTHTGYLVPYSCTVMRYSKYVKYRYIPGNIITTWKSTGNIITSIWNTVPWYIL